MRVGFLGLAPTAWKRASSGGVSGAEAGTLTVMVGGDDEAFARARPVLAAFGNGSCTWARSALAMP